MAYPWYYLLFKLVTDYSLESRLVLHFLFWVCKIMINHTMYFHIDLVWSLNPVKHIAFVYLKSSSYFVDSMYLLYMYKQDWLSCGITE